MASAWAVLADSSARGWHPWRIQLGVGEQQHLEAQGTGLVIGGWRYRAYRLDGSLALESGAPSKVSDHCVPGGRLYVVEYAADGPLAERSRIRARYLLSGSHLRLDYAVHMVEDWGEINHWSAGLYFDVPPDWSALDSVPVSRWVENEPDAPYELLSRQCGEVHYGARKIVLALPEYFAEWAYGRRNPGFVRFAPSEKEPTARISVDLFAADAEVHAYRLAAAGEGFPVALLIESDRTGNLFAPGEPLALRLRVANATPAALRVAVRWTVRDYDGRVVGRGNRTLALAAQGEQVVGLRVAAPERGIYFIRAEAEARGARSVRYSTAAVLPQRAKAPAADSPFGIAGYIASPQHYPDQPSLETVLSLMERIGVHWVRAGVPETAEEASAQAQAYRRHGLAWHAQLSHELVTAPEQEPGYLAWLDRMLPVVVPHSRYIEVGNEYNYWGGHLSGKAAEPYTRYMLRPFHEKLRALAPQARVLNAGVGGVDGTFLEGIAKAGGWDLFDVLSIHTGFHPRAPDHPEADDWWNLLPQMETARDLLRKYGPKPIWVTETYAPTPPRRDRVGERVGADYLARTFALTLAMGAEVVEWYCFQDGLWYARSWKPEDDEYYFGIVRPDLTPKPAYVAYGAMTERLEGKRFVRRVEVGDPDIYLLEFAGPKGSTVMAWSRRERHDLDLAFPGTGARPQRRPEQPWNAVWRERVAVTIVHQAQPVMVTDIMGRTQRVLARNGAVTIGLTGSPLFLDGLEKGAVARLK